MRCVWTSCGGGGRAHARSQKRLKAAGFTSTEDLDEYVKKIEKSLQKARNKELGVDENEGKVRSRSSPPLSHS